jgi:membrane protease subunit (stomatin/prohibitin family)
VIVRESQAAVFFRDGKALDTFGPGRHTISTGNIPLLTGLLGLVFGGQTPFKAEVYYVSLREFLDLKWGTPEPITLRDPDLGMARIRAFGTYSTQINDAQLFVNKIVGTQGLYDTPQIQGFLRGIVISKLNDVLGELRRSLLDLPAMFEEIGAVVRAKSQEEFGAVGLTLKALFVNSVSPTEETARAIDERASMGAIGDMQKYLQFKAARALGDAAQQPGGAGDLTGAGLGLGAGVGLGSVMAQTMRDALQSPPPAAAPAEAAGAAAAPAPSGPLTREQVQATLDNLDMRMANGEISEETYNRLYARWEQKLRELGE